MNQIITLITAIVFYFIGKYSRTEKEKLLVNGIIKKSKVKTGIHKLKSVQQINADLKKTENEKKVDKEMAKLI